MAAAPTAALRLSRGGSLEVYGVLLSERVVQQVVMAELGAGALEAAANDAGAEGDIQDKEGTFRASSAFVHEAIDACVQDPLRADTEPDNEVDGGEDNEPDGEEPAACGLAAWYVGAEVKSKEVQTQQRAEAREEVDVHGKQQLQVLQGSVGAKVRDLVEAKVRDLDVKVQDMEAKVRDLDGKHDAESKVRDLVEAKVRDLDGKVKASDDELKQLAGARDEADVQGGEQIAAQGAQLQMPRGGVAGLDSVSDFDAKAKAKAEEQEHQLAEAHEEADARGSEQQLRMLLERVAKLDAAQQTLIGRDDRAMELVVAVVQGHVVPSDAKDKSNAIAIADAKDKSKGKAVGTAKVQGRGMPIADAKDEIMANAAAKGKNLESGAWAASAK